VATADSLSIRSFLGLELHEAPPDHSTVSRTRRLIDLETHQAVFTWVLHRLADARLVKGKTIGIDASTLEANAPLRSIVRRDTGETYDEFLTRLAQASGIATPTRDDLARVDRTRKHKGSNDDWTHPHDPDAKITKMKDHRTHLAHKAEHAVDLETGAVVAVTVQDADQGDTTTSIETLIEAAEQVETVVPEGEGIIEVVGDKGYHSNQVMVDLEGVGVRSYISEPDRGRRNWERNPEARDAVYRNRRRIRGARGKRLLRLRGERLERPFAHLYETGRMRRVHLRGHDNILKRVLLHAGALNLGLLLPTLCGVGTPRALQGRFSLLLDTCGRSFRSLKRSGRISGLCFDHRRCPNAHAAVAMWANSPSRLRPLSPRAATLGFSRRCVNSGRLVLEQRGLQTLRARLGVANWEGRSGELTEVRTQSRAVPGLLGRTPRAETCPDRFDTCKRAPPCHRVSIQQASRLACRYCFGMRDEFRMAHA